MTYKLLIADDELIIRNGLVKLIQSFPLDLDICAVASDGAEALEAVEEHKPEIALVDINMPQIDGLDFIEKARELAPECRFIILSGYDRFGYAQKALKLGVSDYLLKPVKRTALLRALEDAIRTYESRHNELKRLQFAPKLTVSTDPAEQAVEAVRRRFSDPELNLGSLAAELFMSVPTLSRAFKQKTGITFSDYLTAIRMSEAKAILSSPSPVTIYSIADAVGYSSHHYFCKVFKEQVGVTPSEYRNQALSESSPVPPTKKEP